MYTSKQYLFVKNHVRKYRTPMGNTNLVEVHVEMIVVKGGSVVDRRGAEGVSLDG